MHFIRGTLLVLFAALTLPACEELDPNQSAVEQDHPGDIRSVVEVDIRYRSLAVLTGEEPDEDDVNVLSTRVFTNLSYGSGSEASLVNLSEGDSLTVSTPTSNPVDLELITEQGLEFYEHTYFEPAVVDDLLTVSFERNSPPPQATWFPKGDSPEPDFSDYYVNGESSIQLPPELIVESPDNGDTFFPTDGAEVTVTWSPFNVWTPDNVSKPDTTDNDIDDGIDTAHTLHFRTRCNYSNDTLTSWLEIEDDPGTITVDLFDFFRDHFGSSTSIVLNPGRSDCNIEFNIVRHATGTVDTVFADTSRINATLRSRTVRIVTCPPSSSECPSE